MADPILETHGISKAFGALHASKDISIDLVPGEIHALIGPNGAGKSTLIQQIAGALKPDAGRVILDGEDVTALNTVARAQRGLGRTFQISALAMEDTVLENAMLGAIGASGKPFHFFRRALDQAEARAVAEQALEQVGLTENMATRTFELSHGQRRQLEVAVALTLSPKAFIMDEPMAGLGFEGSKNLTGFLDTLRHTAPILLVEHDMDAVFALADRISVLVYGEVIATGSVEEVRNDPAVRTAYLGEEA